LQRLELRGSELLPIDSADFHHMGYGEVVLNTQDIPHPRVVFTAIEREQPGANLETPPARPP